MWLALNRTVDATAEPVSTDEAKAHLRVLHSEDDTYIASLVKAARIFCEDHTSRAFIEQTWVATFDHICRERIWLPRPNLMAITSVQYRDTAGTLQTWDAANWEEDTDAYPGMIRFTNEPEFSTDYQNPIRITYTAGFGAAASNVPEALKHAIKFIVGHWYEHRQSVVDAHEVQAMELPMSTKHILAPYVFHPLQ